MRTTAHLCSLSFTVLIAACASGEGRDGEPLEEATGVSVDPIIGGTPATAYPEAAVIDIDKGASGTWNGCSGTLVAPRVVLTAGHCVDGHEKWDVYVHNQHRSSTRAVTYDWEEVGARFINPNHHDLGLVFFDQPIALAAYPTLALAPLPDNSRVSNIGRIKNGALTSSSYQASTTIRSAAPIGYPFDYVSADVTELGDSGGAVMAYDTHTIVAVSSGTGGGAQILARVDLLSAWLRAQLAAHSQWRGAQ